MVKNLEGVVGGSQVVVTDTLVLLGRMKVSGLEEVPMREPVAAQLPIVAEVASVYLGSV